MKKRTIFRQAFTASLPVLTGYVTMGFAAGVLLAVHGGVRFSVLWGGVTSAVFVSGPLQFLLVDWVRASTPFADAALLAACLNIRYALYGLSLLDRFAVVPFWQKFYLIWGITDETYALETACPYPPGRESTFFCLLLTVLDHFYWIIGVMAGTFAGTAFTLPSKGIDFAMTALFLVILTDQCRERMNRAPAVIGTLAAVSACAAFGPSRMLIPSMALIIAAFLTLRKRLDPAMERKIK